MFRRGSSQDKLHDYVESRLSAYIDGRVPENERATIRKHLHACDRCRASLESLGWTIKLLKTAPAPALPRQFTLPVSINSRAGVGSRASSWLKWGLAFGSAAAAIVLIGLITFEILSFGAGGAVPAAAPMSVPQTNVALAVSQSPTVIRQKSVAAATKAPQAVRQTPTAQPTQTAPKLALGVAPRVETAIPPRPVLPTANAVPDSVNALECQGCDLSKAPPASATPTLSCTVCGMGGGGNPVQTPRGLSLAAGPTPTVVTDGMVDVVLEARSYPSIDAPVIGSLAPDTHIILLGRDDTGLWLQIFYPPDNIQDSRAWVVAKFVNIPIPVNALPVLTPTPTPTPTSTP